MTLRRLASLVLVIPALFACDGETGAPCGTDTCASGELCCDPCFGQPLYCADGCPRVLCEDAGGDVDSGAPGDDAGPLETDAGGSDAGSLDGGGSADAGSFDAGPFDAGSLDAGPLDGGVSGGACEGQDVRGEGDCDLTFGPYFRGASCGDVSGCSCVGADCAATFESAAECTRLNRGCVLGCSAQDAAGEGPCELILGTFWDGAACVTISGCTCVGDDCASSYEGMPECMDAHRACE